MKNLSTFIAFAFMMVSLTSFSQNREVIHEATFDEDLENWTPEDVIDDDLVWFWDEYGDPAGCAVMSGFDGQTDHENEDWLISPELDFSDYEEVRLKFQEAINYEDDVNGNNKVMISTNYSGSGNPNDADWTELTVTGRASGDSWDFIEVDPVDLSDYDGMSGVYIGFKYTSTDDAAGTWEVDNIILDEASAEAITVDSPSGGEYWIKGDTYEITWTSENFSDNVKIELTGSNAMVIEESVENTGSYSWEIPSDMALADDYKVKISDAADGQPMGESESTFSIIDALYFQGFVEDLGDWTAYSVTGDDQNWYQDSYEDRDYAKMSGYDNGPVDNEDWLISPAFDLDAYDDETISFETAAQHEGPMLKLMVSMNYDGSSNPAENGDWTDITDEAAWSEADYNWVQSGDIDISDIEGSSVYFAFVYESNPSDGSKSWEVDNFMLKGEETNSIADNVFNPEITMYPNPATDNFTVSSDALSNAEVTVFSMAGASVYEARMDDATTTFKLPALEKGVYMVRFVTEENQIAVRQLIVK